MRSLANMPPTCLTTSCLEHRLQVVDPWTDDLVPLILVVKWVAVHLGYNSYPFNIAHQLSCFLNVFGEQPNLAVIFFTRDMLRHQKRLQCSPAWLRKVSKLVLSLQIVVHLSSLLSPFRRQDVSAIANNNEVDLPFVRQLNTPGFMLCLLTYYMKSH